MKLHGVGALQGSVHAHARKGLASEGAGVCGQLD